jgi:hypothetical protein
MYNLLPLHAGHITKIDGKHSLLLLAPCACYSQREAAALWLTWHCLLGHPVPQFNTSKCHAEVGSSEAFASRLCHDIFLKCNIQVGLKLGDETSIQVPQVRSTPYTAFTNLL